MIIKLQRPIWTVGGKMNTLLVYNQDHSIHVTVDATKKEMKILFPKKEWKTYWRCADTDDGTLGEFIEQVEEQPW